MDDVRLSEFEVYDGDGSRGAKRTVVAGLLVTAATGLAYLASLRFAASPTMSAVILIAGRAMLGVGESFMITGALSWGVVPAGRASHRQGHVLDRHRAVCGSCCRRPGRHRAVRAERLRRGRAGDGAAPGCRPGPGTVGGVNRGHGSRRTRYNAAPRRPQAQGSHPRSAYL